MAIVYSAPTMDLKKIRKKLNARKKLTFARSLPGPPLPYRAIVNDLTGCIHAGGASLAALGLGCYIEICGRRIIFNNDQKKEDWKCFNEFLDRYMGLGELLNREFPFEGKSVFLKDAVRNGLVHRFFTKVDSSGIF